MKTTNKIDWTRIDNDINGNPRYVCHWLNFVTDKDKYWEDGLYKIIDSYGLALKRAKEIGGKEYYNRRYGRGIVI